MGITRITLFLTLGAALSAAEASPDPLEKPKPKAEAGATVTVTAEATPVEVAKTPNPVIVLNAETLERLGARTVPELLRMALPGQIVQNGGAGTLSQLNLGGTRSMDTVVTLDGLRMQDSMSLGTNMSQLSLVGVDRLEIQQGPCSTLFGSDAMGGVMALYTAAPAQKGYHGQVSLGIGTEGNRLAAIRQSLATDRAWARLDAEALRSNSSLPTVNPFRQAGSSLAAGFDLWEGAILRVGHRAFYAGSPLPISWVDLGFRAYEPAREGSVWNQQYRANLVSEIDKNSWVEAAVGHSTQTRMEPKYGGGQTGMETSLDEVKVTLRTDWKPFGFSLLVNGLRERGEGGVSNSTTWTDTPSWGEKRSLALAGEAVFEAEGSPLRLVLSARDQEDSQSYRLLGQSASTTDNRAFTYKAGANLKLGSHSRAYGSFGTGFGTPQLYQVLYNAVNAGDSLQNEQSRFTQAGFTYDRASWHVKLEAQSLYFSNLVYYDLSSSKYFNGQNMRFRSLGVFLDYQASFWEFGGFVRSQEARRLGIEESRQLMDGSVIRRPFLITGLRGSWQRNDFRADMAWSWSGSRYENMGTILPSRVHFNDLSVGLAWDFHSYGRVSLRGQNLLQPKVSKEDWMAGKTDFQNDAYVVFNFPAQPRTVVLEWKLSY